MRDDFNTEAFYAALDSQRDARGMTWKGCCRCNRR